MPHDPDFHDTAAAWLDGTGDTGTHRVLREILRDTPDAAVEFAALARADAALQLAAVTPTERLQRARRLIQRSATTRLRRFVAGPAFRVAVAALVVLGVVGWWFMSRGTGSVTDPIKPRLAPHIQRPEAPTLVRTTTPPEKLPPGDRDFARRMSRFIVPEFKATGVPLAKALDVLRKDIAAIDDTAVPDFSSAPEFPDDHPVHLHLRSLPVAVLVDLVAIQTGTKFQPSGKRYHMTADTEAPMPGELQDLSYRRQNVEQLALGSGGRIEGSPPVYEHLADGLEKCLGERPVNSVADSGEPNTGHVTASLRLHKMLRRLITAGAGTPPGTWTWIPKAVEITGEEGQAKFAELTKGQTTGIFSDPEFQLLMRGLSQTKGVDLMTLPSTITRSSDISTSFVDQSGPDPENAPDDWTGIRWGVVNQTIGDSESTFSWVVEISESAPDAAPVHFSRQGSGRLSDGHTMMVHTEKTAEGKMRAFFLTGSVVTPEELPQQNVEPQDTSSSSSPPIPGSPPAPQEDLPYGIPVEGRSGFVYSPYAEGTSKLVDISGLKRGTRVMCPFSNKHFRVP